MRAATLLTLTGVLVLLASAAWWLADDGGAPGPVEGATAARQGTSRPAPVEAPVVALPEAPPDGPAPGPVLLPGTAERSQALLQHDLLSVERRPLPRPDARPRLIGRVIRGGVPAAGVRVVATLDRDVASASVDQLRGLVSTYAEDEGFGELHPQSELSLFAESGDPSSVTWFLLRRSAETDADGRFVLPLPAPGPLQLWVQQAQHDRGHWFPTQALVLELGELLDLTLRLPAGRVEGQLVHATSGEPLERMASLQVYDPRSRPEPYQPDSHRVLLIDETGLLVREVHADQQGRFVLADLPDGHYRLGVDRWQALVVRDGLPEPAELLVPVRPPARLRGLVRRLAGGRSFRDERVHCLPEQVSPQQRPALHPDSDRQRPQVTVSLVEQAPEPRVHDTRIGSFRFDDLPSGRYRMAVGVDLSAEQVLRDGLAVDARLGGDHELTLVTPD